MDYPAVKRATLFEGLLEQEIDSLLSCLSARVKTYKKDQPVYRAGDCGVAAGLVLAGSVHIIKEDFWGNRSILSGVGAG